MTAEGTAGTVTRLVELKALDTSFAVRPGQEEDARRRLMTLLVQPTNERDRGQSEVLHALNTQGESFALKRLRSLPADGQPFVRKGREAALFEEYRVQVAVSHLPGFPRAVGYGITKDEEPVILMEWVDGLDLPGAAHLFPADDQGHARAVASVGASVLRALWSASALEGTFVHRDVSPRNIIVRGDAERIASAFADGRASTCLVDFGSAIYLRRDEATFTVTEDIWRNGTPEYTPPEMLAPHDRADVVSRRSPSIDVYALCSVLYELYGSRTPYRLADHPAESAYELKMAGAPDRLVARRPEDRPLVDAIMSGIVPEQAGRPTCGELLSTLLAWLERDGAAEPDLEQPTPFASLGAGKGTHLHLDAGEPDAAGEGGAARGAARDPAGAAPDRTAAEAGSPAAHRISRRALVAGAGLAFLALGGAAVATGGFGLLRPRSFDGLGWDEIADIAGRIAAQADEQSALDAARKDGLLASDGTLRDDLTKSFALADGTRTSAQVVGIYHDDRSDGRGKAGLTFAFAEPVAQRGMADAPMASGGWEGCDLRAWLADELLAQLPASLSGKILAVDKVTNNQGATRDVSSLTKTSDRLWLFSVMELGGERPQAYFGASYGYLSGIVNGEGSQYRLWEQQDVTTNSSNDELQREFGGSACYWWTRTPSADVSEEEGVTFFNRVGKNGDPFRFAEAADATDGPDTVLPGFCL